MDAGGAGHAGRWADWGPGGVEARPQRHAGCLLPCPVPGIALDPARYVATDSQLRGVWECAACARENPSRTGAVAPPSIRPYMHALEIWQSLAYRVHEPEITPRELALALCHVACVGYDEVVIGPYVHGLGYQTRTDLPSRSPTHCLPSAGPLPESTSAPPTVRDNNATTGKSGAGTPSAATTGRTTTTSAAAASPSSAAASQSRSTAAPKPTSVRT